MFSASVLLATIVLDRMRHRRRLRLYLTVAASWLLLLPEKTSILAAARVGKPHFWTRAPGLWGIVGAYSGFSHEILFVLVLLLAATVLALSQTPGGAALSLQRRYRQRRPVYIATGCLLLVPVAFLLEGLVGTWLFTDRYLQPVTIALAFVTAELCCAFAESLAPSLAPRLPPILLTAVRGAAGVLFGAFTLVWLFHHVAQITPSPPDFTEALTAHMPHNLPVVAEDAFTFTELMNTQSGSGVHYMFLLDWPWAISPASPRLEVTQYHLMENWKLAGYFADRIETADSFLRQTPRFLLIHDAGIHPAPQEVTEIGNPLEERLAHDPQFEVREVFTLDRVYHDGVRDTVWLACRGGCGTVANPVAGPTYCVRYAPGKVCCNDQPCISTLPADVRKKIE